MTCLANLALLERRFERASVHGAREGALIGLVAIQLDRFAELVEGRNEAFSRRLLRSVGQRLAEEGARPTDMLARTRTHGFVWLIEGLPEVDDISDLVERLPDLLAKPFRLDHQEFRFTASAGVAISPFHGRRFAELLGLAEAAMFDVATVCGDALLMPPLPAITESRHPAYRLL